MGSTVVENDEILGVKEYVHSGRMVNICQDRDAEISWRKRSGKKVWEKMFTLQPASPVEQVLNSVKSSLYRLLVF